MPNARSRSGPPAHANKVKYEPNRGDKHNTLNKLVAALPSGGMCKKCTEVIEWKKSYGKYKPLKQPAKCCGCGKRAVDLPYCQLCEACAIDRQVCPKCMDGKGAKGPKPPEADAAKDAAAGPAAAAPAAAVDPNADASPSGESGAAAPGPVAAPNSTETEVPPSVSDGAEPLQRTVEEVS